MTRFMYYYGLYTNDRPSQSLMYSVHVYNEKKQACPFELLYLFIFDGSTSLRHNLSRDLLRHEYSVITLILWFTCS